VVHLALGERLDRLVIGCAIEQLERDADEADLLTVNLSQNSLTSRDFSAWLETTVPVSLAARLILQVSEVDALTAQHHLVRLRECARRIGIGLGVSHFGLMDDPLLYLPLLEARVVTLDGGLLDNLDVDTGRRDRLEALVARLHKRGIRVIAPLVEDFSVLPILWRAGIDLVQGHCLHAPSRRRDFEFVEDVELSTR
jgi:RNase E specificity factor CsrD